MFTLFFFHWYCGEPPPFTGTAVKVTEVPAQTEPDELRLIVTDGVTRVQYVNPAKDAVPPGVVTDTLPDAPAPTTAVTVFALTTVNELAAVAPKLTAVAPVKLLPLIVTVIPVLAVVGVKEVMTGEGIEAHLAALMYNF